MNDYIGRHDVIYLIFRAKSDNIGVGTEIPFSHFIACVYTSENYLYIKDFFQTTTQINKTNQIFRWIPQHNNKFKQNSYQ